VSGGDEDDGAKEGLWARVFMCDGMSGGDEDDGANKGCGVCGEGECSEDSSVDDWVARAKLECCGRTEPKSRRVTHRRRLEASGEV